MRNYSKGAILRRVFSPKFSGLLILLAMAGAFAGQAAVSNSRPLEIEGEPERAAALSQPITISQGTTPQGIAFEVLEYETRAGWICVDFRYWYGATRDGDWSAPGACFIDGSSTTGWGGGDIAPSGEIAITGLLEGPPGGTGEVREVQIGLRAGEPLEILTTPRGSFFAVASGLPALISYLATDGTQRTELWNEGLRP